MGKIVDLESRRSLQQQRRKDDRTADLKEALRSARTAADENDKDSSARRLLDLYRKRRPPPQD